MIKGQLLGIPNLWKKRIKKNEQDISKLSSDITPKTESCIGLKANGQRVYQKVINMRINLTATDTITTYTFNHGIENVNEIMGYMFTLHKNGMTCSLPYINDAGDNLTFIHYVDSSTIYLRNKQVIDAYDLFGVIYYTKAE